MLLQKAMCLLDGSCRDAYCRDTEHKFSVFKEFHLVATKSESCDA
jgi:hypothetical protein